jgi:hypothetical protein
MAGGGGEEARLHPDYFLLSNRLSGRGAGGRGEKEYCHNSKFPFFPGEYSANGMSELWKTILVSGIQLKPEC